MRLFADQHASDRRRRLEARRGVDHVAGDHRLSHRRPCIQGHERFSRVDGDPHFQVEAGIRGVHGRCGVPDGQRGADRALGIVTERCWSAENSDDRIADELLDHTAEGLDLGADGVVVGAEQSLHVLGIQPLGA